MAKNKDALWAFWANMYGSYYTTAQPVYWNEELKCWYDKSGNNDIKKPGLIIGHGCMQFASRDKEEVKNFAKGFLACQTLLRNFTNG